MKTGGRIFIVVTVMSLTIRAAHGQAFSLTSVSPTNSYAVKSNSTNADLNPLDKFQPVPWRDASQATNPGIYTTNPVPLIEFESVPLTVALENLARQWGINYMVDPYLNRLQFDAYGAVRPDLQITAAWTNVTAEKAFRIICRRYSLTMARDTNTSVLLVRVPGHDVNFVTADLFKNSKDTNIIPLIEFQEVPLFIGLKNLATQAGLKCIFSPRVESSRQVVDLCWEKITATQALAAICENFDLNVVRYPESGIIEIGPND